MTLETVKATVDAFAKGKIKMELRAYKGVGGGGEKAAQVRIAPGYAVQTVNLATPGMSGMAYSTYSIFSRDRFLRL